VSDAVASINAIDVSPTPSRSGPASTLGGSFTRTRSESFADPPSRSITVTVSSTSPLIACGEYVGWRVDGSSKAPPAPPSSHRIVSIPSPPSPAELPRISTDPPNSAIRSGPASTDGRTLISRKAAAKGPGGERTSAVVGRDPGAPSSTAPRISKKRVPRATRGSRGIRPFAG